MSDIGKILGYASDDDGTFKVTPTVTVPREQVERTLRVLEAAEWPADMQGSWCTSCGNQNGVHAADCALTASIADLRAVLG